MKRHCHNDEFADVDEQNRNNSESDETGAIVARLTVVEHLFPIASS